MKTNQKLSSFVPVSHEELSLVSGGAIWDWLKSAATWVMDHVYADFKNRVIGIKGRF